MAYRFDWIETPASQIAEIARAYEAEKRAANNCDFDDLLELWLKLLSENPDILKKYSDRFGNILVDDFRTRTSCSPTFSTCLPLAGT